MRILPESPDQTVLSRVRPRFFIQSGHETIYLDQYSLKRKSGGTLEAPCGVRQMNGAPQEFRREGWTEKRSAVCFCLGSGLFGSYNSE